MGREQGWEPEMWTLETLNSRIYGEHTGFLLGGSLIDNPFSIFIIEKNKHSCHFPEHTEDTPAPETLSDDVGG